MSPILEVYVLHHPDDVGGEDAVREVFEHFHGTSFTGLIGGAVEVYRRSAGWLGAGLPPRPIPFPDSPPPNEAAPAFCVAVVIYVGPALARAVESENHWAEYVAEIARAREGNSSRVLVFPYVTGGGLLSGTELGSIVGTTQGIGAASGLYPDEAEFEIVCRDLAQGITQSLTGLDHRLRVFISHTRRSSPDEDSVSELVRLVRETISDTRLDSFFDAQDLQPGRDWDEALRSSAGSSALLSIRSDLYASRAWCQREVRIAKESGMPVVTLDALSTGEERGSFLMDHVPRLPIRFGVDGWNRDDIRRGLNLLVDECLKRELWRLQEQLADDPTLEIDWWAPHAPEPVTLGTWLADNHSMVPHDRPLRILHPDPPLGEDEQLALDTVAGLAGLRVPVEVMTPRGLSARTS